MSNIRKLQAYNSIQVTPPLSGKLNTGMYLKKRIPEFPEYSVDTLGVCRNESKGNILSNSTLKRGYKSVRFCKVENGEKIHKRFSVHRLMMQLFVGIHKDEKKCYVDHIDNDPTNNNISNLRWVTQSENVQRAYDQGRAVPPCAMLGKVGILHAGSKPVIGFDNNGNDIVYFESGSLGAKSGYTNIARAINKGLTSKGLNFKYA